MPYGGHRPSAHLPGHRHSREAGVGIVRGDVDLVATRPTPAAPCSLVLGIIGSARRTTQVPIL